MHTYTYMFVLSLLQEQHVRGLAEGLRASKLGGAEELSQLLYTYIHIYIHIYIYTYIYIYIYACVCVCVFVRV